MSKVTDKEEHEKIVRVHQADSKGVLFENEVVDYFSGRGYRIKSRKRTRAGEVDILARKTGERGEEILLIECKHKERILLSDFIEFVKKFLRFRKTAPESHGYFIYRGDPDQEINRHYKNLDETVRNAITLEKW